MGTCKTAWANNAKGYATGGCDGLGGRHPYNHLSHLTLSNLTLPLEFHFRDKLKTLSQELLNNSLPVELVLLLSVNSWIVCKEPGLITL